MAPSRGPELSQEAAAEAPGGIVAPNIPPKSGSRTMFDPELGIDRDVDKSPNGRRQSVEKGDEMYSSESQDAEKSIRKAGMSPDRRTGRSESTVGEPPVGTEEQEREVLSQGRKYLLLAVFCLGVFIDGKLFLFCWKLGARINAGR